METQNKPTIVLNTSPAALQAGTLVRDSMLVLAALPALVGVLGRGDVIGIVNYLGSQEFAPAAGVLLTGGVLLWRQLLARKAKRVELALALARPSEIKIVGSAK
ncbi:MAG: hypothetical protein K2X76_15300 [Sphingomonas sp.]|nr:hypothetical protein [Sphingomonas sp.]